MTPEIPPQKPDARLRMGFPALPTREVPGELIFVGMCVAMQETGHDGFIFYPERVRTIVAASVVVEFKQEGAT